MDSTVFFSSVDCVFDGYEIASILQPALELVHGSFQSARRAPLISCKDGLLRVHGIVVMDEVPLLYAISIGVNFFDEMIQAFFHCSKARYYGQ